MASVPPSPRHHTSSCAHGNPNHYGACSTRAQAAAVEPSDPWIESTGSMGPQIGFLEFYTITVPVLIDERGAWVSLTQLCAGLGIDAEGQRQLLKRKHWSEGWTCLMQVQLPGAKQSRSNFFIHQDRLSGWLFSIDTSRLRDDLVRRHVEKTQVEFADVLAEWVATGQVKQTSEVSTELVTQSVPTSFAAALRLAAEQAEALEAAHEQLAIAAPKLAAHDRHLNADGAGVLMEQVAKDLDEDFPGIRVTALREFLADQGVLYRRTLDCGAEIWDVHAKVMTKPPHRPRFRFRFTEVQHKHHAETCSHRTIVVLPDGFDYIAARLRRAGWTA